MVKKINPLNRYTQKIGSHILKSEIFIKISEKNFSENIQLIIVTKDQINDFLHLYLLLWKKVIPKNFYLSDSQKKYQTIFKTDTIFTVRLDNDEFTNLIRRLFLYNLSDKIIKQTSDKIIVNSKYYLIIKIENISLLIYNTSNIFNFIFAHSFNILNIRCFVNYAKVGTLAQRIIYLKYYRYIKFTSFVWKS